MMSQPVYVVPSEGYAVEFNPQPRLNQSAAWSMPPAQPLAAPASATSSPPRAAAPRPIIRAKGAEETSPAQRLLVTESQATLTIPSPEEMGITLAPPAETKDRNWERAHHELEGLDPISYRLDKLAKGACRFTCLLPTSQPGFTRRVEAEAATEAEAVRLVLDKAKEWANRK